MSKYSYKFKKKVVMDYLNGEGGRNYLAAKYKIASSHHILEWVYNYQTFGDNGLKRPRKPKVYSFEEKLSVVELYLSSEISYQDLALQKNISSPSLIGEWVKRFRADGPNGLKPHKKGQQSAVDKPNDHVTTQSTENNGIDTSVEHVKELENELYKLRLENAFLKELRRLRLEDEAKTRERRESSPASEDSSN